MNERFACAVLERPPRGGGALKQRDIVGVFEIGGAKKARWPVRAALIVVKSELVKQSDVNTAPGQRQRCCSPSDAAANHCAFELGRHTPGLMTMSAFAQ